MIIESSVILMNTPKSRPSLPTYPFLRVSSTILAYPGGAGSPIVPLMEKLPFESVSTVPNRFEPDAAEPGMFATSSTLTTYPSKSISGIPVPFSTYWRVPETVTS